LQNKNVKQFPGKVQEKSTSKIEEDLGAKTIKPNGMYEGLPYKGTSITIKESDPEYKKPQLTYSAHAKVFNLSNTEDIKEYSSIMDGMVKGLIITGQKRIVYDINLKTYMVFLEWTEQYYVAPPID
jgi:hypothetical protein